MNKTFDVPVLLIFFARNEPFRKVFECIKQIKPSKLYLYQDGPRNEKDIPGIMKCREIADDIDWECDVHKFYQEKNFGCDPSEWIAQRWFFNNVDRGIVLEDDDVASQSFFYFCEELLERYKDDQRINMICGLNILGQYDEPDADYFFTSSGAITGWASWKRVIDAWDPKYTWRESAYTKKCVAEAMGLSRDRQFKELDAYTNENREHYESLLGFDKFLQHRLSIVPTKNMIANIGVVPNATHSVASVFQLPRQTRRIFYKDIYEYEFPLKHPKCVIDDKEYTRRIWNVSWIKKQMNRFEGRIYMMFPWLGTICSDDLKRRVAHYTE